MTHHDTEHEVAIRPRTSADIASAASALVAVHSSDGYPVEGVAQPEEWLSPAGLLAAWVAVLDGRTVGHAAIARPSGEEAVSLWTNRSGADSESVGVLARLFVLPEIRGRSVGESLVQAAMEYAGNHGLRLVLDVMTKDHSAIRLYERLGWQQIGNITHRFGEGQHIDALAYVSPDRA
ncbi:GNAT family N-acetyltransferase [Streptomyces sp. p1417]|uniref:GNAT family N-acetyltransferase n=1 Tax=Streptomyces typhae TaxID=2681492 RepID=A0A6L6XBZ5_9ACTN|nr:GNAT family N-acetyltransferase [Streptomyces typhae]MVO90913.1 GNAT family N-acetyltransferase [Streptomyces typhae]MVO90980.1 GNAT family N-acetyltransferase [Streptomyces typhae]